MKIVIAPDSFKESLSARAVAEAIAAGFAEIFPAADYLLRPVADGGEGTVEAIIAATGGRLLDALVTGPLGQPVKARYGLSGDGRTAVIEMAEASGLALVPRAQRNPLITTSYGVGELIRAALDQGARHLIIGIGGSATNDGGAGMVQALGAGLYDRAGQAIAWGGGALGTLARLDVTTLDPRLAETAIEVACDVDNPLTGPHGASAIFGPQKGATPAMVAELDQHLRHYGEILEATVGQAVVDLPGAGAAGGLGAGLRAALKAQLRPGIDIVLAAVGLEAAMAGADLVITGEGRLDSQTVHGKTPVGVAAVARRHGVPVIALCGSLGPGAEAVHDHGIDALFSVLARISTLDEALGEAAANLRQTARNVAATLKLGGFGAGNGR